MSLAASKGATVHKRSGLVFLYAMLIMGTSGVILALRQSLTNANVLGGFMSAYFVITAGIFARSSKMLPEPLTTPAMRAVPILLVFVAMFSWLWSLRARRVMVQAR